MQKVEIIMTKQQAIQILSALVQGVDPQSGDEIHIDSVLQQAGVIRALLEGVSSLKQQMVREARRSSLPPNVAVRWTADEERLLVSAFQAGDPLAKIAQDLGRTLRGIEARLERLGLMTRDPRKSRESFG
jgi:hypothetical protein